MGDAWVGGSRVGGSRVHVGGILILTGRMRVHRFYSHQINALGIIKHQSTLLKPIFM